MQCLLDSLVKVSGSLAPYDKAVTSNLSLEQILALSNIAHDNQWHILVLYHQLLASTCPSVFPVDAHTGHPSICPMYARIRHPSLASVCKYIGHPSGCPMYALTGHVLAGKQCIHRCGVKHLGKVTVAPAPTESVVVFPCAC